MGAEVWWEAQVQAAGIVCLSLFLQMRILDGKPQKLNCANIERVIFLSNVTRITQWKPLWLKSLICYESRNVTTNLIAERIVQNMHINVLK